MKKKAILGFMTGAAIVAATTGSYAAWDKLSATTKTETVSIRQPITVALSDLSFNDGGVVGTPNYSSDVTFTPENANGKSVQLELNASVKNSSDEDIDSAKYTIEFQKDGAPLTNGVDTTVSLNEATTYKVVLTPTEPTDGAIPDSTNSLAGQEVKVSVTAELKAK